MVSIETAIKLMRKGIKVDIVVDMFRCFDFGEEVRFLLVILQSSGSLWPRLFVLWTSGILLFIRGRTLKACLTYNTSSDEFSMVETIYNVFPDYAISTIHL